MALQRVHVGNTAVVSGAMRYDALWCNSLSTRDGDISGGGGGGGLGPPTFNIGVAGTTTFNVAH